MMKVDKNYQDNSVAFVSMTVGERGREGRGSGEGGGISQAIRGDAVYRLGSAPKEWFEQELEKVISDPQKP